MSLNLDENTANYQIRSFAPGKIKINETIYTKSLIIGPTHLIEDWEPQSIQMLLPDHLEKAAALKPDILLVGTGEILIFPPIEVYGHFLNRGIGIEIMNTNAACRTYNVLCSENRKVVAALILR